MTCCAYCGDQATDDIPAIPSRVCRAHAQEFWTGLLTYVRGQSKPIEQLDTPCVCGVCNDMSMVKLRMIAAGAAAGPSPANTERAPIAAARGTATREAPASRESVASAERHDSPFDAVNLDAPGAVTSWRAPDATSAVRSA